MKQHFKINMYLHFFEILRTENWLFVGCFKPSEYKNDSRLIIHASLLLEVNVGTDQNILMQSDESVQIKMKFADTNR